MTEFDLGCNQASIRHACQCRWAGVNAEPLGETPAHEPRGFQREGVMPRPALGNHPAKQPSGAWHRQQCGSTHASRRLADDGDLARVASKSGNVLLHPFKGRHLVKQPQVGRPFAYIEEPVWPQTIIEGDAYDAVAGKVRPIMGGDGARPILEGAPLNPDQHRQSAFPSIRRPDIEVQVVLTWDRWFWQEDIKRGAISGFGGGGTEVQRVPHAVPGRRGLRWTKTLLAAGGRRIGNAFKGGDSFHLASAYRTIACGGNRIHTAS